MAQEEKKWMERTEADALTIQGLYKGRGPTGVDECHKGRVKPQPLGSRPVPNKREVVGPVVIGPVDRHQHGGPADPVSEPFASNGLKSAISRPGSGRSGRVVDCVFASVKKRNQHFDLRFG